ncbi:MAG: ABC transporter permease subunit [Calditrichaeota bacterium]|nr:ABC transporter permease subunit [Calditrichota bacterium]RQV99043.1 MAG: ABC transporter permease subunit [Calditrichota bacterium]
MKFSIFLIIILGLSLYSQDFPEIRTGSKKFTESVILGEIVSQLVGTVHPNSIHLKQLGGTRILWNALIQGEISIYPEYTGTIIQEILAGDEIKDPDSLPRILLKYRISMSQPLGFNNTYALGMKKELSRRLNIETISDLKKHPDLVFGFTNEFMDRQDGWPSLRSYYHLPQDHVQGLDHDLAYRGLASGSIDVIDLYSTDAEIAYYNLKVLQDDQDFFTDYKAVLLYREELLYSHKEVMDRILKLEGMISDSQMISMNSKVKIDGNSERQVSAEFIRRNFSLDVEVEKKNRLDRILKRTGEHLFLVAVSLLGAILLSIPLGILAFRSVKAGQVILGIVGIIQTIPSLALIVFMIPLLGIGTEPAIMALFLYSLLPIVRNTHNGMQEITQPIRESAEALGMTPFMKLRLIELPLASRNILAGIKTSAVINVGTATLGALIGAGGYGQPILTGIRLDNVSLILEGAIPAALLALLVQWLFDLSEHLFVPKGIR